MMDGGARKAGASSTAEQALSAAALDRLFFEARTPRSWRDKPVERELVERIYRAARMGPTSMNSTPARFVFVASAQAKERLRPALSAGNVDKAMAAPVVTIIGGDREFVRHMHVHWPHVDTGRLYAEKPHLVEATARRNATLQGAYLIMSARAHGLDCGPMSGFDAAKIDKTFFAGTAVKSDFLCCLGYADPATIKPRLPRLEFDQACQWM